MRVLVIGATGTVGREVVSQLVSTDAAVRAMTRSPERAGLPREVEVARSDLTVPSELDACLSAEVIAIAARSAARHTRALGCKAPQPNRQPDAEYARFGAAYHHFGVVASCRLITN